MKKHHLPIFIISDIFQLMLSSACIYSRQVTEQIAANYKVLKNISYGSDKEQDLDIYISKDAKN
jgi:hypothetical protein